MSVVLARVDERLVHGQIITSWTKYLSVNQIYIVDDSIANDSFMYDVLTLSAPAGLRFDVLSVDDALKKLNDDPDSNKTMILFKSVDMVLKLIQAGYPLAEVNLGNVASRPNRKSISKNVSLTPSEIETVKQISNAGTRVYLQMLYTDQRIDALKEI